MKRLRPHRWIAGCVAPVALAAAAPPEPVAPAGAVDPAPAVRVHIIPPETPIAAPGQPSTAPQPLICRSMLMTGSLIARRKQCLTKAQWRYVHDAHEQEARKLMLDNMGRPSCNDAATC